MSSPLAGKKQFRTSDWFRLLLILAILLMQFWFPDLENQAALGTVSTSAPGKKALFLSLEQSGFDVRRSEAALRTVGRTLESESTLCLLGPSRLPTEEEWRALLRWVENGGTLLMAADFRTAETTKIPELSIELVEDRTLVKNKTAFPKPLTSSKTGTGDSEADTYQPAPVKTSLVKNEEVYWENNGLKIRAKNLAAELVKQADAVQAVSQRHGSGQLIVVASDFVFTNKGLLWRGNRLLALKLIEGQSEMNEPVYFDESLNASATPQIVGMLLSPQLRGLTLQILLGVLLFSWWNSRRFGSLVEPSDRDRHNIVDHTNALGTHYYRSTFVNKPLESYVTALLRELKWHANPARRKNQLADLAARLEIPADQLQSQLERAEQLVKAPSLDRATTADLIKELATIRNALHTP